MIEVRNVRLSAQLEPGPVKPGELLFCLRHLKQQRARPNPSSLDCCSQ